MSLAYVAVGYSDGDHDNLGVCQTLDAAKAICHDNRRFFFELIVETWELGNPVRLDREFGRPTNRHNPNDMHLVWERRNNDDEDNR